MGSVNCRILCDIILLEIFIYAAIYGLKLDPKNAITYTFP